jgi:sugar O-acyltransferase (sialic acid O-acetyltransferase NeuD family)
VELLRIFGARVRASLILDLVTWQFADRFRIEGYYDDRLPVGSPGPGGFPVLGTVEQGLAEMPGLDRSAFVALGTRAAARAWSVFLQLDAVSVCLPSLIAPSAYLSPSARVGKNCMVVPGVFIGCDVRIGNLAVAHGGAVVEHHSSVGNNVLLGPGVSIASGVRIAHHVFLGAGCSVVPERAIGTGTLVGAGSVVTRDLPAHVVAYGQPAAAVRPTRGGDEVLLEVELRSLEARVPPMAR